MAKKQIITFEKDEKLSQESQDSILNILNTEGATDIDVAFAEKEDSPEEPKKKEYKKKEGAEEKEKEK